MALFLQQLQPCLRQQCPSRSWVPHALIQVRSNAQMRHTIYFDKVLACCESAGHFIWRQSALAGLSCAFFGSLDLSFLIVKCSLTCVTTNIGLQKYLFLKGPSHIRPRRYGAAFSGHADVLQAVPCQFWARQPGRLTMFELLLVVPYTESCRVQLSSARRRLDCGS